MIDIKLSHKYYFPDLEEKLMEAKNAKVKLIATDGVFSMDGNVAPLPEILELAQK